MSLKVMDRCVVCAAVMLSMIAVRAGSAITESDGCTAADIAVTTAGVFPSGTSSCSTFSRTCRSASRVARSRALKRE